eukprot:XP_020402261.1 probable alpha-mannosidase At5g13980 [Zea mays]
MACIRHCLHKGRRSVVEDHLIVSHGRLACSSLAQYVASGFSRLCDHQNIMGSKVGLLRNARRWCMHDEAVVHYIDMIDQTTLGHRMIKKQFNKTPRAGWQIDPFGHSAVQAYLLGAEDDILMFDYNVEERVNDFVVVAIEQANFTRTNHIMWTMGDDFSYQYAESWFRNMDKLIYHVNKDGQVHALYSTPSIYTDAKHLSNVSWPVKYDEYFPYADSKNSYWTGYYTSRPTFKRYVRVLSGYYLAARQIEFLVGRRSSLGLFTTSLEDPMAIAQHHDAVSE